MSDFNCSSCRLGYEPHTSAVNTCVKPTFRPYKEWTDSDDQAELKLPATLLTEHTYKIPPPMLTPIEQKFVGYKLPYSKIHYELDFSLGAEVDIGCGTEVDGDATEDPNISKEVRAHPLSMHTMSYQATEGRGNLFATPPDVGCVYLCLFHRTLSCSTRINL